MYTCFPYQSYLLELFHIYPVGWGEDKEHGVMGGRNSSYSIASFTIVKRGCGEGTKNRRC